MCLYIGLVRFKSSTATCCHLQVFHFKRQTKEVFKQPTDEQDCTNLTSYNERLNLPDNLSEEDLSYPGMG